MSHRILLAALDFAPENNGKYFHNTFPFSCPIHTSNNNQNAVDDLFLLHEDHLYQGEFCHAQENHSTSPILGKRGFAESKYFPKARSMLPVLLVATKPFAQCLTPNMLTTTAIGITILFDLFFSSTPEISRCSFPIGTLQFTRNLRISFALCGETNGPTNENFKEYERKQSQQQRQKAEG